MNTEVNIADIPCYPLDKLPLWAVEHEAEFVCERCGRSAHRTIESETRVFCVSKIRRDWRPVGCVRWTDAENGIDEWVRARPLFGAERRHLGDWAIETVGLGGGRRYDVPDAIIQAAYRVARAVYYRGHTRGTPVYGEARWTPDGWVDEDSRTIPAVVGGYYSIYATAPARPKRAA